MNWDEVRLRNISQVCNKFYFQFDFRLLYICNEKLFLETFRKFKDFEQEDQLINIIDWGIVNNMAVQDEEELTNNKEYLRLINQLKE